MIGQDAAIDKVITSVPGLQTETLAFAQSYAEQVTSDCQAYVTAKNSDRPSFWRTRRPSS